MMRVQEAASYVQDFNKNCRQMAVLSSFVNETLTVSAAAEVEKKATASSGLRWSACQPGLLLLPAHAERHEDERRRR